MALSGKFVACFVAGALFLPSAYVSAVALDEDSVKAPVTEVIIIQGKANISKRVKKGFSAFRAKDFVAAEKYFKSARNKYDLEADNTFFLISDLWNASNVTGARAESTIQDIEVRKAIAIISYMEGMAQMAQGREISAFHSFKRAIKVNPNHFDAHADLALLQIKRGKPKKAEKHLKKLVRVFENCGGTDACDDVKERLVHVEQAYGSALTG